MPILKERLGDYLFGIVSDDDDDDDDHDSTVVPPKKKHRVEDIEAEISRLQLELAAKAASAGNGDAAATRATRMSPCVCTASFSLLSSSSAH
jgi:hypothetical protein